MKPRQWYRVEAKAGQSIADLYIYDNIGKSFWNDNAVSAKQFVDDLNSLSADVTGVRVHVNSLGGDMFDGIAIANALRDFRLKGRSVETISEGVAASAASLVMMAGSPITMADNATLMMHDPWGFVMGNARDFRKAADVFDGFKSSCVATYLWNTKLPAEDVAQLMAEESWLSADEAIEKGFATQKVEGLKAAACLNRETFAALNVPPKFRAHVEALLVPAPTPEPAPEPAAASVVSRLCVEAGATPAFMAELIAAAPTLADAQARIAADKVARDAAEQAARTAREAADQRATDIRAACALAKQPELADGYVAGGMTLAQVKAHLTVIAAKLDKVEIDGSLNPAQTTPGPRVLSRAAAYRNFNQTPA